MSECKCTNCETVQHDSDCAVHNEPATPNGACDCKGGWISVDDKLPEFDVKVLVYWRPVDYQDRPYHREIITAYRTLHLPEGGSSLDSDQWWAGRYYDTKTFITHWMPIPEPPVNQEEEA